MHDNFSCVDACKVASQVFVVVWAFVDNRQKKQSSVIKVETNSWIKKTVEKSVQIAK